MKSKIDRRTQPRIELRLNCRVVSRAIGSDNSGETSENISRNGLLLRWTRPGPAPEAGSALRVEVELPSDGVFAPRLIRCESTVVRVIAGEDGQSHVALKVNTMRFVEDRNREDRNREDRDRENRSRAFQNELEPALPLPMRVN